MASEVNGDNYQGVTLDPAKLLSREEWFAKFQGEMGERANTNERAVLNAVFGGSFDESEREMASRFAGGGEIADDATDNYWLLYDGSDVVKLDAWIPVGVELPEYGKDVFCVVENCYESGCVVMRRCKENSGDVWEIVCDMFATEPSSRSVAGSVTHWMPMPTRLHEQR